MLRSSRRAWFALALGSVVACDSAPPTDATSRSDSVIIEPIWSGCIRTEDGCQLSRPHLRIWVPEAEPSWHWTIEDVPSDPVVEDADTGVRFSFDTSAFEPVPQTLALWAETDEAPRFTLRLVPDPIKRDNFGFGDDLEAALASSPSPVRQDAARTLLAGPHGSEAEEVARAHYARILAYDASDPGGSADAVLAALQREERLAAEYGFWGVRCTAALVGLFWATHGEKPDLLSRSRQLEGPCRERSAGLGSRFDHYLGKQALHEGAYAEAETRLSNVLETVTRVLPEQSIAAAENLMELYVRTGRWSEAQREVDSLLALPLQACERARAESSIGFIRIRARQSGADLGDPRGGLQAALQAHGPEGDCRNVALETHDLVKLGYDASLREDTAALRGYVEDLSKRRLDGKYRHQAAELKLELAVAEQRFSDVSALALTMAALAEDGEPEARWRRHMIVAKAAAAEEDLEAGQVAYLSAEAVLDDLWAGVDSDSVRARWLSSYRRSALGLMRLRLDAGDLEGAACAARTARLRALELRDESASGHAPCKRDWARREDEVVFFVVPATDEDWDVFEIVDERVLRVMRVGAPGAEGDADWWDPWTDTITSARYVRILASGAALRAPLHRLGWRGKSLIGQRSTTFGLDLDPEQTQPAPASPAASVVFADADPYRGLERYAPDLRAVHATLHSGGWSPRWFDASERAVRMDDAITSGSLLLYYGHGQRVDVARSAPLNSADDVGSTALLIGAGTHWGVEDVSALTQVPRWAVLLGCDVAFPDVESWSGGLNLAHALLLAGTHEVLAATGPVDATTAAELGVPLMTGDAAAGFDLSDALHRASAASARQQTGSHLDALRVWSR